MTAIRAKPPNAQRTYGVLVGKVAAGQLNLTGNSPHYEIWIKAGTVDYRVAVNVRSVDGSNVLVHYDPRYTNPTKLNLAALATQPATFHPLPTGVQGHGLDYLHDQPPLFTITDMHPVPADGAGVTLHNLLDAQIHRAVADPHAVAIAFGESFQDVGADPTFHFKPERGVHDIHMMQGNSGTFASDNRRNGDGALFIRFNGGETMALFVRFTSQSTKN